MNFKADRPVLNLSAFVFENKITNMLHIFTNTIIKKYKISYNAVKIVDNYKDTAYNMSTNFPTFHT